MRRRRSQGDRDGLPHLVARHLPNPQIAARLGLSAKTVRNHVSGVFTKLQVAALAQRSGLGGR